MNGYRILDVNLGLHWPHQGVAFNKLSLFMSDKINPEDELDLYMGKLKGKPTKKNTEWGKRLSESLKARSISIRSASRVAGVTPSVLQSWTTGVSPSDMAAVKRLSEELNVGFCWLLTGEAERSVPNREINLVELFETQEGYVDEICRVRIDRLKPRLKIKKSNGEG